jgi:hypothetical protein
MPVNVTQLIAAGWEKALVSLLDGDGFPIGLSTALDEGSDVGASRVRGVKTANVQVPAAERVTITGDNRPQGAFLFPPGEYPNFDIEVSIADFDLAAALESQVVRDVGDMSMHPIQSDTVQYLHALLWLQSHATSKESGSDGLSCVYGLLMPRVKLAYLGPGAFNEREGRSFKFNVALNPTTRYPWGLALNLDDDGCLSAPMFETANEYWPMLHTFKGDNSKTFWTVDYTPAGDETTNKVLGWNEGADQAFSDVDVATKTLTVAAPIAAGDRVVALYEYR